MSTTEIAVFPMIAGSNPGDPDSPAGKVLASAFDTLRTIDGMQQIHFGTRVEDPSILQLMINWDSKKHHDDFAGSDAYGPFLRGFTSIMSGPPHIFCHADFQPPGALSKTFSAPVTEVAVFSFEGGPEADYLQNVEEFGKTLDEAKPEGYLGSAIGITYEELEKEGVKGKSAVLTIGWQSVDIHMAFRQSQLFKDKIHLLRGNAKKIEMHHVAFMQSL